VCVCARVCCPPQNLGVIECVCERVSQWVCVCMSVYVCVCLNIITIFAILHRLLAKLSVCESMLVH